MHNVLMITCESEEQAYLTSEELRKLDDISAISVYSATILARAEDGSIDTLLSANQGPLGTATGMMVGSILGLFGGATGVLTGAALGAARGVAFDHWATKVRDALLTEVGEQLQPGQFIVVADTSEPSELPVNELVTQIGGSIVRRPHSQVIGHHVEQTLDDNQERVKHLESQLEQARDKTRESLSESLHAARSELNSAWQHTREQLSAEAAARYKVLEQRIARAPDDLKQAYVRALETTRDEADRRLASLQQRFERD